MRQEKAVKKQSVIIGSIKTILPDEYRKAGADMVIAYSTFNTRFGVCLVASVEDRVCAILFADKVADAVADLHARWPLSEIMKGNPPVHREVEKYLTGISAGNNAGLKIPLYLKGTDFQIRVWKELLRIPYGSTYTYGELAMRLGGRNMSRAVGTAIGNNPIGYMIPCHRVLAATGKMGGYRWGIERKRAMLGFEADEFILAR